MCEQMRIESRRCGGAEVEVRGGCVGLATRRWWESLVCG